MISAEYNKNKKNDLGPAWAKDGGNVPLFELSTESIEEEQCK